jgi:contact-dependent growth inhibition (CDI) system CdiI-like immunity protein
MSCFDPDGAQFLLATDCDNAVLGRAVLDALARSRFFSIEEVRTNGFLNPKTRDANYANWVAKLMSAYGFKTRRALFQNLHQCDVTATGGTISIVPKRHVKLEAWEGFAAALWVSR